MKTNLTPLQALNVAKAVLNAEHIIKVKCATVKTIIKGEDSHAHNVVRIQPTNAQGQLPLDFIKTILKAAEVWQLDCNLINGGFELSTK